MHGDEDAPLRWLEPVADIRQRAADDHAHGVGQVAVAEFIGNVQRLESVAVAARWMFRCCWRDDVFRQRALPRVGDGLLSRRFAAGSSQSDAVNSNANPTA